MNNYIIKLYDNEDYKYPLIEINQDYLSIFHKRLKEYQKIEGYNIEDFINILLKEKGFIRTINFDKEVFF